MRRVCVLLLAAVVLSACDRPAPHYVKRQKALAAQDAGSAERPAERPGLVRWDPVGRGFVMRGKPLIAARLYEFDGSTDGFTGVGAVLTPGDPDGLNVVNTAPDPVIRTGQGLDINGARDTLVVVRLTRVKAGGAWSGVMYYSTAAHGEGEAWSGLPGDRQDIAVGETATLVYDMRTAPAAADWTASQIEQIRLDLDDAPGGQFILRQVAIGRPAV